MIIRWRDEFTVWNPELDAHHQKLIQYIQLLDDPERRKDDPESLREVLDGLVAYAAFHFEAEEAQMRETAYPRLEAHQLEHAGFAKDVNIFRATFGQTSERFDRHVLDYLKEWLQVHILTSDKRFGEWVQLCAPVRRK